MKKSNINVEERIRELSTIKVLGFFDQETTLYIYRETIILSIIGILCGYLAAITALVALIMHKKIKSVNMLDALKSVD